MKVLDRAASERISVSEYLHQVLNKVLETDAERHEAVIARIRDTPTDIGASITPHSKK
jgi:hypothetical protein